MATLDLTIDSSFHPYSFEERIKPYLLYKEAYDKAEAEKNALMDKAGMFKYLADATAEDEPAKAIYEGFANDLEAQAADFSKNGLTMNNRRALSDLRGRFASEIGMLEKANERMKKFQEKRDTLAAAGKNILYSTDDLKISNFLDGENFNKYAVDINDLEKAGQDYAKAVSSRIFKDPYVHDFVGRYQAIISEKGWDPATIEAFKKDMTTIPELNQGIDDLMEALGINANFAVGSANWNTARQNIINGVLKGIVYDRSESIKDKKPATTTSGSSRSKGPTISQQSTLLSKGYYIDYDEDGNPVVKVDWNSPVTYANHEHNADGSYKLDAEGRPILKEKNSKEEEEKYTPITNYSFVVEGKGKKITDKVGNNNNETIEWTDKVEFKDLPEEARRHIQEDPEIAGHEEEYLYRIGSYPGDKTRKIYKPEYWKNKPKESVAPKAPAPAPGAGASPTTQPQRANSSTPFYEQYPWNAGSGNQNSNGQQQQGNKGSNKGRGRVGAI